MPFSSLGLSPSLSTPLAKLGYTTPTPVQLKSIPIVLTGSDLLAKAQTGTGKTAAFGLPMIDRLLVRGGAAAGSRKPRGLVLVPTRELALQGTSRVHLGVPPTCASPNFRGSRSASEEAAPAPPSLSPPRTLAVTWSSAP